MKWYRHCAAHFREEDEAGPRLRAYVFDGTMETTTGLDVRSPEMALGNESSICNTRRGNSVPTGAGNKRGKPAGWKMPTWSQCQGRESQCWGLWVTEAHTPHKRDAVTMLHEITAIPLGFSKRRCEIKTFSMYNFSVFKRWQIYMSSTLCWKPKHVCSQSSWWHRLETQVENAECHTKRSGLHPVVTDLRDNIYFKICLVLHLCTPRWPLPNYFTLALCEYFSVTSQLHSFN